MAVLVTGGAGYIASHTVVRLIESGVDPIVLDNFANAKHAVFDRVDSITGTRPLHVEGDIRDRALLGRLFAEHDIDSVIHFAGLKAVGESVEKPVEYYDNNVHGSLVLVEAMRDAGVRNIVFSSSATVYGDPASVPIREPFPLGATNPYGRTKLMVEQILADVAVAHDDWSVCLLRYFNPVGAHASGLIGEDPSGIPNNLMPFIAQVAVGRREYLSVFGDDYPTPDGTGVRDYIHVVDLADGHLAALDHARGRPGCHIFNLGTGRGTSVLELVRAFSEAAGTEIPYRIVDRRPGDIAECWADPTLAAEMLGWRATRTLQDMVASTWKWQTMNPNGYPED
ncbi:MAG: UDP-glucose 4-epimerase GalE [Candidatus Nanopelagicales bacterium]|nr:UDP-glucose 4-epimerase GalE [Candidatus Nanopelagicales bacterium]